jgi:protein TonB
MDPPITIQVLPPSPHDAQPEIIIKPDQVLIDDDMNVKFDINSNENIDIAPVELTSPPMIDVTDEIKNFVDVQASFKGE